MGEVETPLRSLLQELTSDYNETGVDPFEAYELLTRRLGLIGLWYDTYCSSAITSGGHARDDSLNMGQIIQSNTDTAYDYADDLYGFEQLNPKATIEAVAVGKVRHWSQSDYMSFWLSVMSRMPIGGAGVAKKIEVIRGNFAAELDRREVNMAVYNNGSLAAAERVTQYIAHADTFVTIARTHAAVPIERLVRLFDTDQSLGAQTENYFARVMGTSVMRAAVAHLGDPKLPLNYHAASLERDTNKIVDFGGRAFDTERRTQLVLVPTSD